MLLPGWLLCCCIKLNHPHLPCLQLPVNMLAMWVSCLNHGSLCPIPLASAPQLPVNVLGDMACYSSQAMTHFPQTHCVCPQLPVNVLGDGWLLAISNPLPTPHHMNPLADHLSKLPVPPFSRSCRSMCWVMWSSLWIPRRARRRRGGTPCWMRRACCWCTACCTSWDTTTKKVSAFVTNATHWCTACCTSWDTTTRRVSNQVVLCCCGPGQLLPHAWCTACCT